MVQIMMETDGQMPMILTVSITASKMTPLAVELVMTDSTTTEMDLSMRVIKAVRTPRS